MDHWIDGRRNESGTNPLIHLSINPFRNWSARQELHLRSLGPKPSALLLRYAPIALTAVSSGQEKRRTLTLVRSCGKIIRCSSRREKAHFDKDAPKTQIRASSRRPLQYLKMALPVGLAPTLFPQTTGCFSVQLRELKMVGGAGNAPVVISDSCL